MPTRSPSTGTEPGLNGNRRASILHNIFLKETGLPSVNSASGSLFTGLPGCVVCILSFQSRSFHCTGEDARMPALHASTAPENPGVPVFQTFIL